MSNEVTYTEQTAGVTTDYFTIQKNIAPWQFWNTSGTPNFQTQVVANASQYKIALAEITANGCQQAGTFPAIAGNMVAGYYLVTIRRQAGGSPAFTDPIFQVQLGYWDGTTFNLFPAALTGGGGATAAEVWSYINRTLTGIVQVTVVSPILQNQDLELTPGDSYDTTTNQPIVFADDGSWPTLTDTKCAVSRLSDPLTPLFVFNTPTTAGPPQTVSLPFPPANTIVSFLPGEAYRYNVKTAVGNSNTEVRTFISGQITVLENIPIQFP